MYMHISNLLLVDIGWISNDYHIDLVVHRKKAEDPKNAGKFMCRLIIIHLIHI